ncbi:MAG: HAMP domain-containing protein [Acidobacteria bacterium]|nr:HAMP domain-containing protein [Acidobacteriota bacterium]
MTLRFKLILSFVAIAILAGVFSAPVITFIVLALAAVVSYALLNQALKPIGSLVTAINEIATGPNLREIKIGRAPQEIEVLVASFNRMQQAIRERRRQNEEKLMRSDRLAVIGQLAAGVAHEINNPLGSILLFTRLVAQQSPKEGQIHDNLVRIEKETKRCHSIVQNLLDFARQRKPNVEQVDVNELLDATIQFFERQFFFQNIEVVRRFDSKLQLIQADELQLQQVFMNLIINAVDAMDGKGLLTLETEDKVTNMEVRVSDTGCGIQPENLERIFDPFFTTKDVGRGTGLGLSVSYGIVQNHGGEIKVTSTPGSGSRFTVVLPIARESA